MASACVYPGCFPCTCAQVFGPVIQESLVSIYALVVCGASVDYENALGDTALLLSLKKNNMDAVNALLENGADLNYCTEDGVTSMLVALALDNEMLDEDCSTVGFDFNAMNRHDRTILMEAARRGAAKSVEKCLALGAHPDITNSEG